jgi:hypothetical protein
LISSLGKLLETSLTFSATALESIALIIGVGELSGGVTLPRYVDTSLPGGEEKIMTPKQDTLILPTQDAASSSLWNTNEMDGEPMIDSQDPTQKPLQKEMEDNS